MNNNLNEISDGKLYGINDMVKVGCHDCVGCSLCCRDMGTSILLDPYDAFQLTHNLNQSFEQLLTGPVELHVEDGLILPNLKMQGTSDPACAFLNEQGRCSIHGFRPGLCRLFPLGRNYEEDVLTYFLLLHECPAGNKSKMKVGKWLEIPDIRQYQEFLVTWHGLTKNLRAFLSNPDIDDSYARQVNLAFLQMFYIKPYEGIQFYGEFHQRVNDWKTLGI
jgi:hypothetical protein